MEKRILGKTGLSVSILGFGCAELGYRGLHQDEADRLVGAALDSGIDLFDSAAAYKQSEKLLGNALKNRRNQVYLVTKCGSSSDTKSENWSKAKLLETIEASLVNFQSDRLDVVLLHSCSSDELVHGESGEALLEAKKRGYARFIGYSGDGANALEAIRCGIFDVLETSINIADQESIGLLLPLAIQNQLGVIAKRPIANAAWRYTGVPTDAYHIEYYNRLTKLKYPFLVKPEVAEIALRFTLFQPGVHTAIVGTTNPERFKSNATIVGKGPLSSTENRAIRDQWSTISDATWVGQT